MKTRPILFLNLRPGMLLVDPKVKNDEIETVLSVDKENGTFRCIWITKHGEIACRDFRYMGGRQEVVCDEVEEK